MEFIQSAAGLPPGLYTGTSNLVLPIPKNAYPPAFQGRSRLRYFASLFNSVEINSSFYKLPMSKTVARWASEVPEHFRFSFKLSKSVTHAKGLQFAPQDIIAFMNAVAPVGDKMGCILVQFPPSIKYDHRDLVEDLLDRLHSANEPYGFRIAMEFRDASWYRPDVYRLLDNYGISTVFQDIPASATPAIEPRAAFRYLRFHGPGGKYRGSYTDQELAGFARRIQDWQQNGKQVFAYFNNTMGEAFANLQALNAGLIS